MNGFKLRVSGFAQSSIESFAFDTGTAGDIGHSTRAGNNTERMIDIFGIACLQGFRKKPCNVFVCFQILGSIEF
jgi:hypothetical protein